jgi:large subunit ribosomal protein L18
MPTISHRQSIATKRKMRVRAKLFGTAERPRLSITRTNKFTYMQAIDDEAGKTLVAASDIRTAAKGQTKTQRAETSAKKLAEGLQKLGIKKAVIDRGSYRYHGRVKAVADAVRAVGLEV